MKIFETKQIQELDQYTIRHEPISSLELMERAADAFCNEFLRLYSYNQPVCILAGPGNNGGDALAVGRMLLLLNMKVRVIVVASGKLSDDCSVNLNRIQEEYPQMIQFYDSGFIPPVIGPDAVIIDGLFGSGLSRPLQGIYVQAVDWVNSVDCSVVSIDIPSGLFGEGVGHHDHHVVKADLTISLQFPKLSFFQTENEKYVGCWRVVDIGLHPLGIKETETSFFYSELCDVECLLKTRAKFSHKGTYGHGLLVAGSEGVAGAAVLSAMGSLRSGIGLLTVCSACTNREIIQSTAPEALFIDNQSLLLNFDRYNAIAIGPGIGVDRNSEAALQIILSKFHMPVVLDADALNVLAINNGLISKLPENSILTPHPKEFDRLFGPSENSQLRLRKAIDAATCYRIIIVLKGANSAVVLPSGEVHYNSSGNAGMATGGSGDVLTGILLGLLAQNYTPANAAILAVYLHGMAADIALKYQSQESLIARDIVENLGAAYRTIHQSCNRI